MVLLIGIKGIDGGPVTGSEDDVPELAGVGEVVLARDGHDGWPCHASADEQVRKGRTRSWST